MFLEVELEGSNLLTLRHTASTLPNPTVTVSSRESVEQRGTSVRRGGHEEECWRR